MTENRKRQLTWLFLSARSSTSPPRTLMLDGPNRSTPSLQTICPRNCSFAPGLRVWFHFYKQGTTVSHTRVFLFTTEWLWQGRNAFVKLYLMVLLLDVSTQKKKKLQKYICRRGLLEKWRWNDLIVGSHFTYFYMGSSCKTSQCSSVFHRIILNLRAVLSSGIDWYSMASRLWTPSVTCTTQTEY